MTGIDERPPQPPLPWTNPNVPDVAHHPDQAFVPYLVSGDVYYLEELQMWAMWVALCQNPHELRRGGKKGLLYFDQARAQGWAIRTLAHAAYISPPGAQKSEFEFILKSNIDYYDARFTNSDSNEAQLGVLLAYYGSQYIGWCNVSNWMDDFFTQSIGRLVELGYDFARPLLNWKAKWVQARLTTPGTSPVQAAAYQVTVRPDAGTTTYYTNYKQVYDATFSTPVIAAAMSGHIDDQAMAEAWAGHNAWRLTTPNPSATAYMDGVSNPIAGDMDGYSDSVTGYPSNMQPAVAYIASYGPPDAPEAWKVFNRRTVKPDYAAGPQFAIVPRAVATPSPTPTPAPAPDPAPTPQPLPTPPVPMVPAPVVPVPPVVVAPLIKPPAPVKPLAPPSVSLSSYRLKAGTEYVAYVTSKSGQILALEIVKAK